MPNPQRCHWVSDDPLLIHYHDFEWGQPTHNSIELFKKLQLEVMQCGLNWSTILHRRKFFREQTKNFDPIFLATLPNNTKKKWLNDPRFIRHPGKINAWINNAKAYLALKQPLAEILWSKVNYQTQHHKYYHHLNIPGKTTTSTQLARQLKSMGFQFVGPTTCYALMQAAGLVNDHLKCCYIYSRIKRLKGQRE